MNVEISCRSFDYGSLEFRQSKRKAVSQLLENLSFLFLPLVLYSSKIYVFIESLSEKKVSDFSSVCIKTTTVNLLTINER